MTLEECCREETQVRGQPGGIAQGLCQLGRHAHAVLVGFAQIPPEGMQRPVGVLDQERPIQPHGLPGGLQYLLGDGDALGVELFCRRVAGGQVHQKKGEKADGDQNACQMQQPLAYVFFQSVHLA